ncbi:MAG: hypothetical protein P8I47_01210 [Schleiferiaceae bacterium]|jgi:hypothetical protein|nr:hypothetical protein [Schleiferiaceae bacterium]MDG1918005.1 hypothetical protein [Schleiferiaceae bacterium]MDG2109411.1 hypothetical protein [Schleiferiaceae bacterium]
MMKSIPPSVPVGRCATFLCLVFFSTTQPLSAQNERDTSVFVDKSDPLTIFEDPTFEGLHILDEQQNSAVLSSDFLNEKNEKSKQLRFQRPPGQQQKVVFDFQTTGKYSAVYSCELIIDSTFLTSIMSCCDIVLPTAMLSPHVAIRKAGVNLSLAHYPLSSYYPIVAYGDGTLYATGSAGYFFLPPNLYPSSQPLQLKGSGPHKVYWLGEEHPDSSTDFPITEETEMEDTTVRFISGKWQRRIRLK